MSGRSCSATLVLAVTLGSVLLAQDAGAQGLAASEAARVRASVASGDRVTVVRADGGIASGVLVGTSGDSLRVRGLRVTTEIPLQEIVEVQKRGDPPWNGLLIGAVLGAAIGFGTYTECEPIPPAKTCEGNLTTSRGMETLAAAALFGAIGLTADALTDRSTTVYRAAPARRGFSVAVTPTRVSARYRIQF